MPSLLELQERFGATLESCADSPVRGIDVYRHAIGANYRRALGATYRVAREILGDASFDAAVDAFVAEHPPRSGDLNVYGDELAQFVERWPPTRSIAGLPDLARLEWAADEASRAAEAESTPAAVVAALSTLEDDAVGEVCLVLHPSCRLLVTAFAVYETWRSHQAAGGVESLADAQRQQQFLLVRRGEGRVVAERIDECEFTWLNALAAGETFGDSLARALELDAAFDLAAVLRERIDDGTICAVRAGRYNPPHG